jgi:adenylate cyclase
VTFSGSGQNSRKPRAPLPVRLAHSFWKRLSAIALLLIPIALGMLLALALSNSALVERIRYMVFDQYQRWQPREWHKDLPVRVVDIDEESLAKIGQWPWPRARLAEMTRKLTENGAAVISYDVILAEEERLSPRAILSQLPQSPERDALAEALRKKGDLDADPFQEALAAANSVLAVVLTQQDMPRDAKMKTNFVLAGDDPIPALRQFTGLVQPLPALREAANGLGAIQYVPDQDLIIRRVPLVFAAGPPGAKFIVPGLAAESLRVAQPPGTATPIIKTNQASGELGFGGNTYVVTVKIGDFEIPVEHDGALRVHYAGTQPGRTVPAWKVFEGSVPREELEGRIVLIGSRAASLFDLRATPLEPLVAGVDIHAEALEHIVSGATLVRPLWAPYAETLAILLAGLLMIFIVRRASPVTGAVAAAVLILSGAALSWLAFSRLSILVDPLIPGATWLTTYVAATIGVFRRSEREKRFVRSAFSRYLAPAMVERIAADPSQLALGGETREVTILFSDVRGFTERSETLEAEGVVRFLNALHTPMTAEVLKSGGTVDKYIGDGLMAFWNAPLDVPGHANNACRAALAMIELIPRIDARMKAETEAAGKKHIPVRIGIGLNTGNVFVGNMGSEQRFDYSIIGDAVNVTARLESATKDFGIPILVSEGTRSAATDFLFLDLGAASLKGKTSETAVFALHGPKSEAGKDFQDFAELHGKALRAAMTGSSDLGELVSAVRAHPLAQRYTAFYDRLEARQVVTEN